MNIDFSSKPQITIDLPQMLEAFCRWLFNTPTKSDYIIVNRNLDLGKMITSQVLTSDTPVKKSFCEHPVKFILPVNKDNNYSIRCNFLYVSRWGQQKINDYIEALFNLWVRERFDIGYKLNWTQKDIADSILRGLNLRNNAINYESIIKIDYRNRRRKEEKRFKELLSA